MSSVKQKPLPSHMQAKVCVRVSWSVEFSLEVLIYPRDSLVQVTHQRGTRNAFHIRQPLFTIRHTFPQFVLVRGEEIHFVSQNQNGALRFGNNGGYYPV